VYCGQTVGWIKTSFGTEVGLGPCHIVLDWEPSPPKHPFSICRPAAQKDSCSLAMYRYRHNDVPKCYLACTKVILQNTCTEIDLICTEVVMYRNCPPLVPKLSYWK